MYKLLIAGIVAATSVATASAQPTPDASYNIGAYSLGRAEFLYTAGNVSSSGVDAYGSTSSTASATAAQSVSTTATSIGVNDPNGGTPEASSYAIGRYYFEVTGPSSVLVPLLISGRSNLTFSGDGESDVSEARYSDALGGVEYQENCRAGLSGCGAFTYTDAYSLLSGDGTTAGAIGSIQIRSNSLAMNGSASATIDTMIMIDPTFADARLYSIAFSDGVTNGAPGAAPEPATWAMLLIGFGLVGFVMRRRPKISTRAVFAS